MICKTCGRYINETDADAEGNCVFCQASATDRPTPEVVTAEDVGTLKAPDEEPPASGGSA
jgi:hypothetical protein